MKLVITKFGLNWPISWGVSFDLYCMCCIKRCLEVLLFNILQFTLYFLFPSIWVCSQRWGTKRDIQLCHILYDYTLCLQEAFEERRHVVLWCVLEIFTKICSGCNGTPVSHVTSTTTIFWDIYTSTSMIPAIAKSYMVAVCYVDGSMRQNFEWRNATFPEFLMNVVDACNGFRLNVTKGGVRVTSTTFIRNSGSQYFFVPVFVALNYLQATEPIVTRHVFIIKGITDVLLHLKMRRGCNKDTVSSYIQMLVFRNYFRNASWISVSVILRCFLLAPNTPFISSQ